MDISLSINGIATAVTRRSGENPAIVCIHGNSLSKNIFNPLWNSSRLSDYAMLLYDLPGHGQTSFPADPENVFTLAGYASHLKNLIAASGFEQVILLGFSLGGHIAMEAARTEDQAIKGVFTVGSPPIDSMADFPDAFISFPGGYSLFSENLSDEQIAVISDNISEDENVRRILTDDIRSTDTRARRYLAAGLNCGKFNSEHQFLSVTDIPCRITFGSNDKLINPDYFESPRLRNLLGYRLRILNNCLHLPAFTEHGSFMAEFISFLEESNA